MMLVEAIDLAIIREFSPTSIASGDRTPMRGPK